MKKAPTTVRLEVKAQNRNLGIRKVFFTDMHKNNQEKI